MDHIKWLKEKITQSYGSRCPDYADGCRLCQIWEVYDDIAYLEENARG
ncbi:MAG: hypothetical protein ACE5FT_00550 [Candidatus Nanoarchaeia archaeon]